MNLLFRSTHNRVSVPTDENNGLLKSYEKALNAGRLADQYDLLRRIEAEALDSAAVTATEDQLMRDVPDIPVDLQSLVARAKRHNRSSQYVTRFVECIRRNKQTFEFAAVTYPYIAALVLSALLYAILEGTFTVEVCRQLGLAWLVMASSLLILCTARASRALRSSKISSNRWQGNSFSESLTNMGRRGFIWRNVLITGTCVAVMVLSPLVYLVIQSASRPTVLAKARGEFNSAGSETFDLSIPHTDVTRLILEMQMARIRTSRPVTIVVIKGDKIVSQNTWADDKASCAFTFRQFSDEKLTIKLRDKLDGVETIAYTAAVYREKDRKKKSLADLVREMSDWRKPL